MSRRTGLASALWIASISMTGNWMVMFKSPFGKRGCQRHWMYFVDRRSMHRTSSKFESPLYDINHRFARSAAAAANAGGVAAQKSIHPEIFLMRASRL
jgi:hypothetical protein